MSVVLVVSNGYAEDLVGARIASELRHAGVVREIAAFPMVGKGEPYRRQGVRIVGLSQQMPSGGFARTSVKSLVGDMRSGLVRCLWRQVREMRSLSDQVHLTICVGDVFLLCMSALGRLRHRILVATAKSEYISGHMAIERLLMRRLARAVVARDQATSDALQRSGVCSRFFGNFLMDIIDRSGRYVHPSSLYTSRTRLVCLLPGSRRDFVANLRDMLRCLEVLPAGSSLDFVASLAHAPEDGDLRRMLPGRAWSYRERPDSNVSGHAGDIILSGDDGTPRLVVAVVAGRFGDIVDACDLVIGMAGTAVEQAVGLGKPAVTFPGRGAQFTAAFARAQKRLLGDSVCLVSSSRPRDVVNEVASILSDSDRYAKMSRAGVGRMGEAGAASRFVEYIRALDGVTDGA
jgi:uncharacterized protein (TIGR03492 family)